MLETLLQNYNVNLPINADYTILGTLFATRYFTSFAKSFLRKVEKILLFYLFVFIGYELYIFIK